MRTLASQASMRGFLTLAALIAAVSVLTGSLWGQTEITCPDGGSPPAQGTPCLITLTASEALQTRPLRVRVMEDGRHVAEAVVRFRATSGTLLPDSVVTDGQGYAQTLWYRTTGADAAVIAVDARTKRGSAFREIRVSKQTGEQRHVISAHSGNFASWFEKAPLRHPIVVEVIRAGALTDSLGRMTVTDSVACRAVRVAFTRIASGSLTPDTATADVDSAHIGENPNRWGCFARAYWTLGEGPGRRHVRASLVGAGASQARSNVVYEAYARASPRLIGGILGTWNRSYLGVKTGGKDTVQIERTLPDGSKISFDSTFSTGRDTVESKGGNFEPAAFVGISTPVVPSWHEFAVTVGVDPKSIDRNWYAGVSVLRIPFGLAVESLPVDIHVLGHFGRNPVVKDRIACESKADCETREEVRWHGFAGMLSIDASSVITDLIKKLSGS